jgi:16S rRNA (guanine966-N2)-methyltransferase
VKIIGGAMGGRSFSVPVDARVRPMSDKVREALFNILGDISGLTLLDAYAGTGAVGFEALSRGSARVVAVEKSKKVAARIQQSATELGLVNHQILPEPVEGLVNKLQNQAFDLIIADPPYAEVNWDTLNKLGEHLAENGVLVVSHSSRTEPAELQSVKRFDTRKYGDTALSFYRKM